MNAMLKKKKHIYCN